MIKKIRKALGSRGQSLRHEEADSVNPEKAQGRCFMETWSRCEVSEPLEEAAGTNMLSEVSGRIIL